MYSSANRTVNIKHWSHLANDCFIKEILYQVWISFCAFLCVLCGFLQIVFTAKDAKNSKGLRGNNKLRLPCVGGLHPLVHFLRRYVFLVGCHGPDVSERILQRAGTISIELILQRLYFLTA